MALLFYFINGFDFYIKNNFKFYFILYYIFKIPLQSL